MLCRTRRRPAQGSGPPPALVRPATDGVPRPDFAAARLKLEPERLEPPAAPAPPAGLRFPTTRRSGRRRTARCGMRRSRPACQMVGRQGRSPAGCPARSHDPRPDPPRPAPSRRCRGSPGRRMRRRRSIARSLDARRLIRQRVVVDHIGSHESAERGHVTAADCSDYRTIDVLLRLVGVHTSSPRRLAPGCPACPTAAPRALPQERRLLRPRDRWRRPSRPASRWTALRTINDDVGAAPAACSRQTADRDRRRESGMADQDKALPVGAHCPARARLAASREH